MNSLQLLTVNLLYVLLRFYSQTGLPEMVSSETVIRRSGKCYVIWYTQFGAQVSINTW